MLELQMSLLLVLVCYKERNVFCELHTKWSHLGVRRVERNPYLDFPNFQNTSLVFACAFEYFSGFLKFPEHFACIRLRLRICWNDLSDFLKFPEHFACISLAPFEHAGKISLLFSSSKRLPGQFSNILEAISHRSALVELACRRSLTWPHFHDWLNHPFKLSRSKNTKEHIHF